MRLSVNHTTKYSYSGPVNYGLQQLRFTPQDNKNQKILNWRVSLSHGDTEAEYTDQHGNIVSLVSMKKGADTISISVSGEVETHDTQGIFGEHTGIAPLWLYKRYTDLNKPGDGVKNLCTYVESLSGSDLENLHALSAKIRDIVDYETGQTEVMSTAEDALRIGHGVCQDHTHIFTSVARVLGFPARYVSGYLRIDGVIDQEATHAWSEAYIPGLGWTGFDVSNIISPDDRYIRLACGLDFKDAAPISGLTMGNQTESLDVTLQVQQ